MKLDRQRKTEVKLDFTEFFTQSQYIPRWGLPAWIAMIITSILYFLLLVKLRPFGISKKKAVTIWFLTVYLIFIYCGAVLTRETLDKPQMRLELFWSYKWGIQRNGFKLVLEILLNILMFLPVGTLLPAIMEKPYSNMWILFFITMLTGLCCSCLVEILQLFLKCGLCELDDIIHNVLGTAMGYGIFVFAGNRQKHIKG